MILTTKEKPKNILPGLSLPSLKAATLRMNQLVIAEKPLMIEKPQGINILSVAIIHLLVELIEMILLLDALDHQEEKAIAAETVRATS
ncbi:hypothetical protein DSO57_1038438 [Entomophthora muscae]|uniref:Uncharacterized protein n=1 Tax=Entomophthora muscae TaxID=34485 RepID=A0ACC2TKD0_9FUNG|nr:hypothetical protein DSO57_1038438 [Entomophthora muscae]